MSRKTIDYEVIVKTGDVKGAGTDSNVYCVLVDKAGNKSRDLLLDCRWKNDFEKGCTDTFKIRNVPNLGPIESIELWRDSRGIGDDWFVEYLKVRQSKTVVAAIKATSIININDECNKAPEINMVEQKNELNMKKSIDGDIPFPCNRWIQPKRKYTFLIYDSVLPQFDTRKVQRNQELEEKKIIYAFSASDGLPRRVSFNIIYFFHEKGFSTVPLDNMDSYNLFPESMADHIIYMKKKKIGIYEIFCKTSKKKENMKSNKKIKQKKRSSIN